MEFLIRDGKMSQYRDCPACAGFIKDHPTLKAEGILRQKRKKDGTWYHLTKSGRILHRYVSKRENKNPDANTPGPNQKEVCCD